MFYVPANPEMISNWWCSKEGEDKPKIERQEKDGRPHPVPHSVVVVIETTPYLILSEPFIVVDI